MSEFVKNIIDAELQKDEKLLWSHVISQGTSIEPSPYVSGIWRIVQPIVSMLYFFSLFYWVKEIPSEQLGDILKQQLPIWIAFGIILWFFTKTVIGKRLQEQTERPIFQNGIITDKRVLLFNHLEKRQEFFIDNIKDAGLDYENGGRALRISSHGSQKPSVLIGIADFQSALAILQSRFLKSGNTWEIGE